MNHLINTITILVALRFSFAFAKIFIGIYIGTLIDSGLYHSNELNVFPLYLTDEEEYQCILRKITLFIEQILKDVNCTILINGDNINCLIYKGLTPVKPYQLKTKIGLLFYCFEENRLFKKKMDFVGPGGVYSIKEEVLFVPKIPYSTSEKTFTDPEIFVKEDFLYPNPPSNKLEEWIREKESNGSIKGAFIYRSPFIRSLFNSDLNFAEEEIVDALKKITSVKIVDNQLIFTADNRG
jgi:hypothetical protein